MSTLSWSSRVRHDDDATWQEWSSELFTKLGTVGLVQTSDTGQLTAPVVASRPGVSTIAGYWIFRMNDSLQGTAPVFFRIEIGTGNSANVPIIKIGVGTGTNGSGTLTGTAKTTINAIMSNAAQATDVSRQSLMCCNEGFFGLNWKLNATQSEGLFLFSRTCDAAGAMTATGAIVIRGNAAAANLGSTQALRYAATAAAYTEQSSGTSDQAHMTIGFSPQGPVNSTIGSNIQAFLGYTISPQASPLNTMCGVYDGEISATSTFTATLVGTTPRTYIGLTTVAGPFGPVGSQSPGGIKFAMLWE